MSISERLVELCVADLQYLGSICFLGAGFDHRTPACCAKGTLVINDFVSSDDTSITPNPPVQFGFSTGIWSHKSICWLRMFLKVLHLWIKLICLASAALLYNLRTKSVSSAACWACTLSNRSSIRKWAQKELKAEKQNKIKTRNLHNKETRKPSLRS